MDIRSAPWIITMTLHLLVVPVFRHMEVDGGFKGDDIPSEILKFLKLFLTLHWGVKCVASLILKLGTRRRYVINFTSLQL
jgi:hypothetical protein